MAGLKIHITSNGCPRRGLDISRLAAYFKVNGCVMVSSPGSADYIIFVTCAFLKSKEDICMYLIDALSYHKGELIVLGCLPSIAPERLKENFSGKVLATKDIHQIDLFFKDFKIPYAQVPDANEFFSAPIRLSAKIKRFFDRADTDQEAYLRISNGCYGGCSYCPIQRAVGRFRSKSLHACAAEYETLLKKGKRSFVFLADNVGAYGIDIGSSLPGLLDELSDVDTGIKVSWKIQGLHPCWVIKYEKQLLKYIISEKIIFLSCPLQSGSDRILMRMNRGHNISEIQEVLLRYHKANAGLLMETDIMVGFPSESREDFFLTLEAVKQIRFGQVWIYPYYDATDTPSSRMENEKISQQEIEERLHQAAAFFKQEGIGYICTRI